MLSQAEKDRNNNKQASITEPVNSEPANTEPANTVTTNVTRALGGLRPYRWIFGIFIFSLVLLNFGLIFRLFTLVKTRNAEINTSLKVLEGLEKSLDSVNKQIHIISSDLTKIKQDNNTKIAELEKQIDLQVVMVRDLNNAKDTLFHRVNNLESKLNEINQ